LCFFETNAFSQNSPMEDEEVIYSPIPDLCDVSTDFLYQRKRPSVNRKQGVDGVQKYTVTCRECGVAVLALSRARETTEDTAAGLRRWTAARAMHADSCVGPAEYEEHLIREHMDLLIMRARQAGILTALPIQSYLTSILDRVIPISTITVGMRRTSNPAMEDDGLAFCAEYAKILRASNIQAKIITVPRSGLSKVYAAPYKAKTQVAAPQASGAGDGETRTETEMPAVIDTGEAGNDEAIPEAEVIDPFNEPEEGGDADDEADIEPVDPSEERVIVGLGILVPYAINYINSPAWNRQMLADASFGSDPEGLTRITFSARSALGMLLPLVLVLGMGETWPGYEFGLKLIIDNGGLLQNSALIADGTRTLSQKRISKLCPGVQRLHCAWHDAQHEGARRQPMLNILRAPTENEAQRRLDLLREQHPALYRKRLEHLKQHLGWIFAGTGNIQIAQSVAESLNAKLAPFRASGPVQTAREFLGFALAQRMKEIEKLDKATSVYVPPVQTFLDRNLRASKVLVVTPVTRSSGDAATSFYVLDPGTKRLCIVEITSKPICSCGLSARTGVPCAEILAVAAMKNIDIGTLMHPVQRVAIQKAGLQAGMRFALPIARPTRDDSYALPSSPGTKPGRKKKLRCKAKCEGKGHGGLAPDGRCASCGEVGHDVDVIPVGLTSEQVEGWFRDTGR
jgi:hypothetical protein